jgi:O-antigen/teichoic acid export membrane protein
MLADRTRHVLVNRLAMPVAAFFLLVVIGRQSDVLLGEYALVTTFFFIMQTLPLMGLTPFVMREVARDRAQAGAQFATVGLLAMCAGVLVGRVAIGVTALAPYGAAVRDAVGVVSLCIVPGMLAFLAEHILIALERTGVVAWVAVGENALRLVLSAVLVIGGAQVEALIWVLLLTRSLALACYLGALSRNRLIGSCLPSLRILRRVVPVLPAFLAGTVLALSVSRLDYLVLSLHLDATALGHYAIAYRLLEIFQMMVAAALTTAFPRIAQAWHTDRHTLTAALRTLVPATLGIFCVAGAIACGGAALYVRLLFAHQYPQSVMLAQLFAMVLPLVAMDAFLASVLLAIDRQAGDMRSLAAGASAYAIALSLLVPPWLGYGALVALVIAATIQLAVRAREIERGLGPMFARRRLIAVGAGGIACELAALAFARQSDLAAAGLVPLALILVGLAWRRSPLRVSMAIPDLRTIRAALRILADSSGDAAAVATRPPRA